MHAVLAEVLGSDLLGNIFCVQKCGHCREDSECVIPLAAYYNVEQALFRLELTRDASYDLIATNVKGEGVHRSGECGRGGQPCLLTRI